MSDEVGGKIIRTDLVLASGALFVGSELSLSMGTSTNGIVFGVVVALLTAVLAAGADRGPLGLWVLSAVGVLAIVALVLVGTEPWLIAVLPVGMLGLGVGLVLNRIAFGVVGPVPTARIKRGF